MAGVPGTKALILNTIVALASFAGMALIFTYGWKASERFVWRFSGFNDVTKADWCARSVTL